MSSRTWRQRMLMPFLTHPPPTVMHLTWLIWSKTWFVCKQYVILHINGRSTAISEDSKNVGDQVYFELRSSFQFWTILMLKVESIFGKLLKLDHIVQRNISQIFWVSVKSQHPCQKRQKQANKRQNKHKKRRKWIFILKELQTSSKCL